MDVTLRKIRLNVLIHSQEVISISCRCSILTNDKCFFHMEPLEDSNERSIIFGRPIGTQERLWTIEGD